MLPLRSEARAIDEIPLEKFCEAIRSAHGAEARLLCREYVHVRFDGTPVWEGEGLVFELEGHPIARLCYAWEVDGEVTAVLHEGPVDSPEAAVRAAIMATGPEPAEAG